MKVLLRLELLMEVRVVAMTYRILVLPRAIDRGSSHANTRDACQYTTARKNVVVERLTEP